MSEYDPCEPWDSRDRDRRMEEPELLSLRLWVMENRESLHRYHRDGSPMNMIFMDHFLRTIPRDEETLKRHGHAPVGFYIPLN